MPDIASLLKAEISRLARKEVRSASSALKKAMTSHRSEILALKRRADALEREVARGARLKAAADIAQTSASEEELTVPMRFSAKGLAMQRRRLGLSANECGTLLNASGQSIYNWESGAVRPRASHMPAIAAMRKLGKREAAAILESVTQT